MSPTLIALGTFQFDDDAQHRFARLCGDVNPVHMDPVAARRLLAGQPVAHGIHTLLQALERLPDDVPRHLASIACDFVSPVCVGDRVDFSMETGGQEVVLVASVNELPSTRITLSEVVANQGDGPGPGLGGPEAVDPIATGAIQHTPADEPPQTWVGKRIRISLPTASFERDFPRASKLIGERRASALALLSYFVGMVCPGLHSLFASLNVTLGGDEPDLMFEVRGYDSRFKLFVIAVDGCISGEVRAFRRAAPQPQVPTAELLDHLSPEEFKGSHTWVIGGSRGLGELTAKLVAAGGGRVTLTYSAGMADAQQVVDDINVCGRGRASARKFDLTNDAPAAWIAEVDPAIAIFFFATPRIFRKRASAFEPAVLREFLDFYAVLFHAFCAALEERSLGQVVTVFYPSTVYIDERPRGMTEYAMAKAAAEVLLADLAKSFKNVRFIVKRLPRLATDQTSSMFAQAQQSNMDFILPVVREVLATKT